MKFPPLPHRRCGIHPARPAWGVREQQIPHKIPSGWERGVIPGQEWGWGLGHSPCSSQGCPWQGEALAVEREGGPGGLLRAEGK